MAGMSQNDQIDSLKKEIADLKEKVVIMEPHQEDKKELAEKLEGMEKQLLVKEALCAKIGELEKELGAKSNELKDMEAYWASTIDDLNASQELNEEQQVQIANLKHVIYSLRKEISSMDTMFMYMTDLQPDKIKMDKLFARMMKHVALTSGGVDEAVARALKEHHDQLSKFPNASSPPEEELEEEAYLALVEHCKKADEDNKEN